MTGKIGPTFPDEHHDVQSPEHKRKATRVKTVAVNQLKQDIDPSTSDLQAKNIEKSSNSPLTIEQVFEKCKIMSVDELKRVLQRLGTSGVALLHHAVVEGELTLVHKLLLAKVWGAELQQHVFGHPPLWTAISKGHKEIAKLLRENGAHLEPSSIRHYKTFVRFEFPNLKPKDKDELLSSCQKFNTIASDPHLSVDEAWAILESLEIVQKNYQNSTFSIPTDAIVGIWPPNTPTHLIGSRLHSIELALREIIEKCQSKIASK